MSNSPYFSLLASLSTTMTICLHLHNDNNRSSSCFVRQQQRCVQFRDIPRAFCIEVLCANCLHMLTNNKIPNIDPGGEWLSFIFSMVPELLLQQHVMQARYQTIDHDYIPAPCGAMICYRGARTLAESRRLDSSTHFFSERRSIQDVKISTI